MQSSPSLPPLSIRSTRWFHWAILAALLVIGAVIRFDRLGHESAWPDEFWGANYLSTGRGNAVFNLPGGVLLAPPPHMGLAGAPSWPHVWTGLQSAVHPPIYSVLLRWWMDIFGQGDFAVRSFSVVMSLLGIIVLFDTVRRTSGPATGLIAAALMTLAVSSINQSQDARPYTLLALLGLLACRAMLEIEWHGPTPGRLIFLGVAVIATALTHYFAAGALVGLGVYALVRLRGRTRKRVVIALFAAVVVIFAAWFPWFWQQRQQMSVQFQVDWAYDKKADVPMVLLRTLIIPGIHLYFQWNWSLSIATSVLAYALPLVFLRRRPHLLIWWFWVVGTVASLTIYDARFHTWLLGYAKYSFILTPALFALLAEPLPWPGWRGWAVPALLVVSVAIFANERWRDGPMSKEDWRDVALAADRLAGPHDPLIFYPSPFWGSPGMWYLDFDHYVPNSQRPVMMLYRPADAAALRQLAGYQRVWLIGPQPQQDSSDWLPGFKGQTARNYPGGGGVEEMVRAAAAVPSAPPSPPSLLHRPGRQ